MTIEFGWWIIPMIVTATYGLWVMLRSRSSGVGDYNFAPLAEAAIDVVMLVPVLIVWLAWALLR